MARSDCMLGRVRGRGALLATGLVVAGWIASSTPVTAQVSEPVRGFVGPDLGPASRPSGVPPNSGLVPGTQARPPGDPGATIVPDHLRRPPPPRVERYEYTPPRERAGRSVRRRPPAVPRSTYRHCQPGERCR